MIFETHKVVGQLPVTLMPNTLYLVRVAAGFDLYCTDSTGSIAYKPNNYESFVVPLGFPNIDAELTTDEKLLGEYFPFDFVIQEVLLTLTTAPTGSSFIVDIKQDGVSLFSTLLSVDADEKTSVTATTPCVLTTTSINKGSILSFSVVQVGATIKGQYPVLVINGVRL